jgi:hypothetical protein
MCGVKSSQLSYLIIYHAMTQACKAVWHKMRREESAVKQVRRIQQSEAIRNIDEALQHVTLSFGE